MTVGININRRRAEKREGEANKALATLRENVPRLVALINSYIEEEQKRVRRLPIENPQRFEHQLSQGLMDKAARLKEAAETNFRNEEQGGIETAYQRIVDLRRLFSLSHPKEQSLFVYDDLYGRMKTVRKAIEHVRDMVKFEYGASEGYYEHEGIVQLIRLIADAERYQALTSNLTSPSVLTRGKAEAGVMIGRTPDLDKLFQSILERFERMDLNAALNDIADLQKNSIELKIYEKTLDSMSEKGDKSAGIFDGKRFLDGLDRAAVAGYGLNFNPPSTPTAQQQTAASQGAATTIAQQIEESLFMAEVERHGSVVKRICDEFDRTNDHGLIAQINKESLLINAEMHVFMSHLSETERGYIIGIQNATNDRIRRLAATHGFATRDIDVSGVHPGAIPAIRDALGSAQNALDLVTALEPAVIIALNGIDINHNELAERLLLLKGLLRRPFQVGEGVSIPRAIVLEEGGQGTGGQPIH